MKRLFAKLLSFFLMLLMFFSVVMTISSNFPSAYRILRIRGEQLSDGDYIVLAQNREEELLRIPKAGGIIEGIAQPGGFAVCTAVYFMLLCAGRKRTPQRKNFSAVHEDNYCESVDDVSVFDTSEGEVISDEEAISLSDVT